MDNERTKMRLIDLDEFAILSQNNVADLSSLDEETDINCVWDKGYLECLKVLDSCPVIRAIPIDWINKWTTTLFKNINGKTYYWGDGYDTVWDMIEAWEKENEVN